MSNAFPDLIEQFEAMNYSCRQNALQVAKEWLRGKDGIKYFCNGKLETSESSKNCEEFKDLNTNEVLATVAIPSEDDINTVFQSSAEGQKSWEALDHHFRGVLLLKTVKKLDQQKALLSDIEALAFGSKPSTRNLEVAQASLYLQYYTGWAHMLHESHRETKHGVVVVCLLKPSPLMTLIAMVSPALAAGNAVLINPAYDASLSAFVFAEICSNAGLPVGVVNVIPGPVQSMQNTMKQEASQVTVWGPRTCVRDACSLLADSVLPVIPFSFGKTCSIIFNLTDISSTVDILVRNMSFSCRQHPWSVQTIFVEESLFPIVAESVKKKLVSFQVGGLRDLGVDIQLPQKCDKEHLAYLKNVLRDVSLRGVEIYQIYIRDDLYYSPTVIVGSEAEINVISKDYDALPFVSLVPFRTSKDAVDMVNKVHFGAAVSLWTDSLPDAISMAKDLEVGTVWINDHGLLDPSIPFSNWKEGGIGSFGGQEGMYQYIASNPKWDAEPGTKTGSQSYPKGSAEQFQPAVNAAKKAQIQWAKQKASERAALLLNAATLFHEKSGDFQSCFKAESGSRTELELSVNEFYYWASRCDKLFASKPSSASSGTVQIFHYPRGVIAIVLEDNSELESLVSNVVRAISFGNSVVIIPNEKNPNLVLKFCELLNNSKIPTGLVNVLHKAKQGTYNELVEMRDVKSVWYAGNQQTTLNNLYRLTNKTMKYLWCCASDRNGVQYAASQVKSVWFPSEK